MSETEQTIRAMLSSAMGRNEVNWLRDVAVNDAEKFDYLFEQLLSDDAKTSWHAAWALEKVSEITPDMFSTQRKNELEHLTLINTHQGKQRLLLSILLNLPLSLPVSIEMLDLCYDQMTSSKEPVSVKVLSMKYLERVSVAEPDLLPELISTLEILDDEFQSAGFINAKMNLLKRLQNQISRQIK